MKKNSFLEIKTFSTNFNSKLPFIPLNERGEYEIYNYLINQKRNNKKDLILKTYISNKNKEFKFSNFGFSEDGNILGFIYEKKYLIIFDKIINSIKFLISLPDKIKNNLYEFVSFEKRSFFKKIFSRISFNEILFTSNNIFLSSTGNKCLISSSKETFKFF